ncbi:MAG: hypothetical protein PHE78_07375 [Candidatus Gastranaerophilales bacterium]|nr:hypothetical protein [Candidatus Gastranaerophilales bacterium]
MSAEAMIEQVMSIPYQVSTFIQRARAYFTRVNPVENTITLFLNNLKNMVSVNKKLKIAKYRVAHLNYRLTQMERMMIENNPNNFMGGKSVDTFR